MSQTEGQFTIEDAKVVFANFKGVEKQFNDAGKRNFCIILDEGLAMQLMKDGWNIKRLKDREMDGEVVTGDYYIEVTVAFKIKPPRLVMIGEQTRRRTELNEELAELLDQIDAVTWDVTVSAYEWDVNGKTGIKAYAKSVYVVIEEDYLELKYAAMEAGE